MAIVDKTIIADAAGDMLAISAAGAAKVEGTIDLGATDNSVLDAIAASVAAIDTDATTMIGHLDGVEGLLTTIDADTGNAVTALQLIDDLVAVAHDAVDSGNPVKQGFKAISALPAAVAASDRANGISDLWGRQLVAHIDPAQFISKSFNATTTQTGTDVWSPASGKKIAITSIVIGTYGTTAARLILWFGANADTTYSAGTDQLILAASFAPSATAKPGLVFTPSSPIFAATADHEIHCTTDAGMSVDIVVHGYEF